MRFRLIPYRSYSSSFAAVTQCQISHFARLGQIDRARNIFDDLQSKTVTSWNAIVAGYFHNKQPDKNEVTWTAMLKGYTRSDRINEAAELFKAMPVKPVAACNEMIMGFGLNGEVGKARWVFDQMKEKDDGTWSALIKIYERKGFELEALALFRLMQSEGVRPNFPSIISILSVCGSLASLDHGRQVHSRLLFHPIQVTSFKDFTFPLSYLPTSSDASAGALLSYVTGFQLWLIKIFRLKLWSQISTQPSILHNSSSEIIIIFISGSVLSSSDSSSSILNLNNEFSVSSDHTPQVRQALKPAAISTKLQISKGAARRVTG
ncbi:hypothetical protein SADUNF_Sadunf13G0004600 [Salix dunnii]|uniref:Pentatricopeptide repeat-containing protein n=1 Tax=Salix dunnii TaxID=1413687 RepID=A0A835JGI4_9ROSI|nr:hypothetical protein SADUNF_Sadunf13G0004600 [Salix dunnii]